MKHILFALSVYCMVPVIAFAQTAEKIISDCIEAHGGERKITSLQSVKTSYMKHMYWIEQSERPTGPYLVSYEVGEEIRKASTAQYYSKTNNWNVQQPYSPDKQSEKMYVSGIYINRQKGSKWYPVRSSAAAEKEAIDYSFEHILGALLHLEKLELEGSVIIHGTDQWKLRCQADGMHFRLYVSKNTHLITCLEYSKAYTVAENFFWSFWGDYSTKVYYSMYALEKPGILYPLQVDVFKEDWPYSVTTYSDITINPIIPDSTITIPAAITDMLKKMPAATGFKLNPANATKAAPGITLLKGAWNVSVIDQSDGVYILEGPISNDYSRNIMDYVKEKYPGKKIKGVITTVDAWPHIGGLREYVAASIPVYCYALNKPIVDKLLSARFITYPDALATGKKIPKLNVITEKTILGDKNNAIEVYAVRGQAGERMLMVYFPASRTLYGSDLVQASSGGKEFFMPSYLLDLKRAVERNKLQVETIYAMHSDPVPWKNILDYIDNSSQ